MQKTLKLKLDSLLSKVHLTQRNSDCHAKGEAGRTTCLSSPYSGPSLLCGASTATLPSSQFRPTRSASRAGIRTRLAFAVDSTYCRQVLHVDVEAITSTAPLFKLLPFGSFLSPSRTLRNLLQLPHLFLPFTSSLDHPTLGKPPEYRRSGSSSTRGGTRAAQSPLTPP